MGRQSIDHCLSRAAHAGARKREALSSCGPAAGCGAVTRGDGRLAGADMWRQPFVCSHHAGRHDQPQRWSRGTAAIRQLSLSPRYTMRCLPRWRQRKTGYSNAQAVWLTLTARPVRHARRLRLRPAPGSRSHVSRCRRRGPDAIRRRGLRTGNARVQRGASRAGPALAAGSLPRGTVARRAAQRNRSRSRGRPPLRVIHPSEADDGFSGKRRCASSAWSARRILGACPTHSRRALSARGRPA